MSIVKAFNNHFQELLEDILSVFPDNKQIKKAKMGLEMLQKANPKLILLFWREKVYNKYRTEIDNGDIDFFLNKDYKDDIVDDQYNNEINQSIDKLREPVKNMGLDNQNKVMKYLQNLSKLSLLYQG